MLDSSELVSMVLFAEKLGYHFRGDGEGKTGMLQSLGSQRVGPNLVTEQQQGIIHSEGTGDHDLCGTSNTVIYVNLPMVFLIFVDPPFPQSTRHHCDPRVIAIKDHHLAR